MVTAGFHKVDISPYAFVAPVEQKDPFAGAALLSVLRTGAVEVHRTRSSFEAGGRGRVVLFGFRPQYRAQSWATYVPLLNAIYTSAATAAAR